jgi:hypothetical protein
MSLPALEDIAAHSCTTDPIEGLIRVETYPAARSRPTTAIHRRTTATATRCGGQLPDASVQRSVAQFQAPDTPGEKTGVATV